MSGSENPQGWFDRPQNVKRLVALLACACALTLVLNVVLHPHGHLEYEDWFGFHAVFGFLAYLFIVGGAVQLRKLVKREEDYYDR